MRRKHRGIKENANAMKRWTLVCLSVVLICAVLLRGVVIYQLYPIDYKDEVLASSNEFSLDPYFVCAVIASESGFDVDAVSPKGAIGLMQIMPETGAWVAGKLEIEGYTQDMLLDPASNIRIGCWYLSYLSGEFDGDINKIIAAYNAGPARLREWLESGISLDDLPFQETDNYVKRVNMSYKIYKGIYDEF